MALPRRADGSVDVLALIRETSHLVSGRELDDDGPYDRRARLATCRLQRESRLERTASTRVWAAMMLALHIDTCESILLGRRVLAGRLDGEVLRRGRRGAALPDPNSYIDVSAEMLDAVAEAGPLPLKEKR
jgi:hypothetical protein